MSLFDDDNIINPSTGLPMFGGIGGIDIGGDTFGLSSSQDSMFESSTDISSGCDDVFSSISEDMFSSSCDDSFSSTSCFDDW